MDSTDSQNRVGSWSCEGRMPDTSWEATECRGVSRSKNLKKQSKGESHPKLVHDSETATECVSLEQRRRLIEKQLCTIHPNPGPRRRIHGGRNMEQKMERRKKRRDRRQKRSKEEKTQQLRIATWNLQGITTNENNRIRLRSVADYVRKQRWDMVLVSELRSEDERVILLGKREEQMTIIHSKRAGIILREGACRNG